MLSETDIRRWLKPIQDPELRQSVVDLGMVRRVQVDDDAVTVAIALTVAGCPLHTRIREEVLSALAGRVKGRVVRVDMGVMTPEERKRAIALALSRGREQKTPSLVPPVVGQAEGHLVKLAPYTVGVASGKGGVGKSTVTANLAVALARRGWRVGVMDLDVYGFSQGRLFGLKPRVETADGKMLPQRAFGVQVLSMAMMVQDNQAIIWRGPLLGKAMRQFFEDARWEPLDWLLLDLPPGTGDVAVNVAQQVPSDLVIVTTPQPLATEVAVRAGWVARRLGQRLVGVVENMSFYRCPHGDVVKLLGEGGGEALARALQVPLLAQLPIVEDMRGLGDAGIPVASIPDAAIFEDFQGLAARLEQALGARTPEEIGGGPDGLERAVER
jgi:ATP-binding protein involved in chromosome partitioning